MKRGTTLSCPRVLGLLLLISGACDAVGQRPTAEEVQAAPRAAATAHVDAATFLSSPRDAGSAPAPHALGEPARALPRMHVSEVIGAVHSDGVALAPGVELSTARTLSLERGASVTLSLHDYVRVHLVGPAVAQLLPDGEPALLLREGLVTLDVAPRGARSIASAFWLATPTLRLDVPDSVRVAVRAFPDSASELAVVSGYLTVAQPRQPLAVPAGSSVCVSLVQAKLVPLRVATLELAEASLRQAKSCAPKARTTDEALERAHQSAAAAVATAAEREREQLAEHRREASVDAGAALQLREQLAHLGAELMHLRDLSQALHAQHAARALKPPR